ncbi:MULTISPECIES: acyl-CoA carboxylase subunit epsilon [unclassified Streptomyces]|uniref:acyl-CoA carboxylase subunit epsilon n=1 Tax=unclassified Streptomyces TaxID=2593676 RepID=UPI002740BFE0|nr:MULTISPECIES: acyl-CoA carboxylase subunit epsilon [unclassified Streptomyces]
MTDTGIVEPLVPRDVVRVERGRASAEELAAVLVVLLGLRAQSDQMLEEQAEARKRRWRGPEAYQAPGSWK